MPGQRSSNSRLLAIGFAVLVVGVLLVLVIIRNADDDPAQPSPVATGGEQEAEQPTESSTPMTPEQLSTARLPLPLEVPDGTEAVAVRLAFDRAVAAIPAPGDRVNVYRALASGGEGETPRVDTGATAGLPDPGPAGELFLPDMQVLAVTGPLPSANDGTLTVVLAVPGGDVPELMPVANARQLWFTLLPSAEEDATDTSTESTEEAA